MNSFKHIVHSNESLSEAYIVSRRIYGGDTILVEWRIVKSWVSLEDIISLQLTLGNFSMLAFPAVRWVTPDGDDSV